MNELLITRMLCDKLGIEPNRKDKIILTVYENDVKGYWALRGKESRIEGTKKEIERYINILGRSYDLITVWSVHPSSVFPQEMQDGL